MIGALRMAGKRRQHERALAIQRHETALRPLNPRWVVTVPAELCASALNGTYGRGSPSRLDTTKLFQLPAGSRVAHWAAVDFNASVQFDIEGWKAPVAVGRGVRVLGAGCRVVSSA